MSLPSFVKFKRARLQVTRERISVARLIARVRGTGRDYWLEDYYIRAANDEPFISPRDAQSPIASDVLETVPGSRLKSFGF